MANTGLQKVYDDKRTSTLSKIQEAIDFIQADRRIVTKKELIELTGLSSGTFSRPYVKELLEQNRVCQYRGIQIRDKETKEQKVKELTVDQLTRRVASLESKIQDYDLRLEKKSRDLSKAQADYDVRRQEHTLLRGKYQQLLEYLDALGVDMTKLPLI